MTTEIIRAGGYTARATVHEIDAVPGQFTVCLESNYKDSRDPEAWRTIAHITCESWGLEALGREINKALQVAT